MVQSMISLTTLPQSFWGYALKIAAHTLNRVPFKAVESTPYELWRGRKPSFSYFKIWGCEAYVKRLMTSSKLEPKSDKVIFVGYPKETRGDDSKSQEGYLFCLNGGAFSWKSFKEDTTADLTTEAEYIAAAETAKEAVWIKKFITKLGVVPSINDPISLFCDNTGAIAQAKEPRSHQKTKHIVRRYHIIREIVDRGDVMICKVDTDDNIADPLTKPLGKLKHEGHTRSMGI
ncbi:unnamed protein product [Cuscuta campestris]|uniref:Reverse transcriptase Ty1/copia-type domain-containing protein n=1 Tax=Cuscuta campestris TaxID=132261 RepID=A0A484LNH9_9ASTE|nr:unnamed protein product [Cuscuta campestris]